MTADGRTAMTADADPTAIRSVAVTTDDVVTALEATIRGRRDAVLRITPPFEGRKRARLHLAGSGGDVASIHLDPRRLVDDDAPAYPEVDATEDELRAADEYSPDTHRDRHAEAVAEWRGAVRDHLVETIELETDAGACDVAVHGLG